MRHKEPFIEPELFATQFVATCESPIGKLWVASDGKLITAVSFTALPISQHPLPNVLLKAQVQLKDYFAGRRREFDLPIQRVGSRFQQLAWKAMQDIPYGKAASYKTLGAHIGGRANGRNVGFAASQNPIPIIVPCHRLIGSTGLLTGYVGGLWRKRWLLQHEGALPKM